MLSNWSSPFIEETKRKPRQKIISSKPLDTEDEPLANYVPPEIQAPNSVLLNKEPEYNPYKSQDSILLDKLNYMIYLLEEQRDEKTGQVTEELILYVFLGIFTLFVLDTFVKNGKYSR
jgi:hypothetical protein